MCSKFSCCRFIRFKRISSFYIHKTEFRSQHKVIVVFRTAVHVRKIIIRIIVLFYLHFKGLCQLMQPFNTGNLYRVISGNIIPSGCITINLLLFMNSILIPTGNIIAGDISTGYRFILGNHGFLIILCSICGCRY